MKTSNSIRHRLVLAIFALACLVVSIFAGGLYIAFDIAEDALFDDNVLADVEAFVSLYRRDPGVADVPRNNFRVYVAARGSSDALPAYLRDKPSDADEVLIDGNEYELQIRQVGEQTLYLLFDESEFEEFEQTLLSSMALIMTLIIAGSVWAGVSLADRIIRPLTSLSQQVSSLAGDPAGRCDVDVGTDDEIATLARAINCYHERITELLQREREFSADVSHELRTPIMAVQGAAELLGRKVESDGGATELVDRIKRGCFGMTTLTEALLFLARDPGSFAAMVRPVSIRQVVEDQIAAVRDMAARKGVELRINDAANPVVATVPAVVAIVIGNILKNAVKYTDQNVINVFLDSEEVVIQDYGPGIDRTEQATLFDRFDRGRGQRTDIDGCGIGLALVKRFCEQYGWSIKFQSSQDAGTRVALAF